MPLSNERLEELRVIVSDVLEVEPEELTDTGDFQEEYEADSLRAIEILARLDKAYGVEIPQAELAELTNLKAVYQSLAKHAGWD